MTKAARNEAILRAVRAGEKHAAIASEHGVTTNTVRCLARRSKVVPRQRWGDPADRQVRNINIFEMNKHGIPSKEIARRYNIKDTLVRNIIWRMRQDGRT